MHGVCIYFIFRSLQKTVGGMHFIFKRNFFASFFSPSSPWFYSSSWTWSLKSSTASETIAIASSIIDKTSDVAIMVVSPLLVLFVIWDDSRRTWWWPVAPATVTSWLRWLRWLWLLWKLLPILVLPRPWLQLMLLILKSNCDFGNIVCCSSLMMDCCLTMMMMMMTAFFRIFLFFLRLFLFLWDNGTVKSWGTGQAFLVFSIVEGLHVNVLFCCLLVF